MDFYYQKFPKIPAGIVKKIDKEFLHYEPYRSFSHYELLEDLKLGKECECNLEDGRKIIIISPTDKAGKLKTQQSS